MRLADVVSQVGVRCVRNAGLARELAGKLHVSGGGDVILYVEDVVAPCQREVYFSRVLGHRRVALALRSASAAPVINALFDLGWSEAPRTLKVVGDVRIWVRVDAVRHTPNGTEAAVVHVGRFTKSTYLLGVATAALTGWRTYLITLLPDGRLGGVTLFDLTAEQRDAVMNAVTVIARQLHQAFSNRQPPPPERGPWCARCPYQQLCHALQKIEQGVVPGV